MIIFPTSHSFLFDKFHLINDCFLSIEKGGKFVFTEYIPEFLYQKIYQNFIYQNLYQKFITEKMSCAVTIVHRKFQ